jgi:anti-anti-sigma factor
VLEPASVHTNIEQNVQVVVVSGEIDMTTAPLLAQELTKAIEAQEGPVVLDLCEVGYFDSSGLRATLVAHQELTERGRRLLLACPPDGNLRRTLAVTGLGQVLSLHPNRRAALAAAA